MPSNGSQRPSDTMILEYLTGLFEQNSMLDDDANAYQKITIENHFNTVNAEDKLRKASSAGLHDAGKDGLAALDSKPVNKGEPPLKKSAAKQWSSKQEQAQLQVNLNKGEMLNPAPSLEFENPQRQKLQSLLNTGLPASQEVPIAASPEENKALPSESIDKGSTEALPLPKRLPEADDLASSDKEVSESQSAQHANHHLLEWAANGRPMWAQERFDVLLFEVAGLALAVPLIALGQIQAINEELTPIFGQAEWFMGLLSTPAVKIRTVNTALFVMPERYSIENSMAAKYVVSLDGSPWGLAVDKVNQPTSIDPREVNWRGQRGKRPWLAGTVKSAMCALIDVPNLLEIFNQSDIKLAKKTSC